MAGVRVYWQASPNPVVQYEVYKDETLLGITGPGTLFFDDTEGTVETIYRVKGFSDQGTVVYDTGPFQIPNIKGADLTARKRVDHNYLIPDNYRYVAPSGAGVPNATIRVYKQPDWLAGKTELAIFVTETDDEGRWKTPVYLEQGLTYVLVFSKENAFGPNMVEIVV